MQYVTTNHRVLCIIICKEIVIFFLHIKLPFTFIFLDSTLSFTSVQTKTWCGVDCFLGNTYTSCLGSGAVGFAHLDGSCTEECVVNMVHRIQELSMGFPDGRLEMSLIGGFTHVLRYSEQVFYSLMGKCRTIFFQPKSWC